MSGGGGSNITTKTTVSRGVGETVDVYIDPKVSGNAFIVARITSNAPTVGFPLDSVADFVDHMGDNVRCVRLHVQISYYAPENLTSVGVSGVDEDGVEHSIYGASGTGDISVTLTIYAFEG